MKAAVLHNPGSPLVVESVDDPRPGAGEILIKVRACGICHTDLHLAEGAWPLPKLPLILGHEVAGEVEAVGPEVTNFKMGDRAGVPWVYSTCGQCEYCTSDRERFCAEAVITGFRVNGGYAEYIKAPASHAVAIPPEIGFVDAAPIYCAGVTSYRALKHSGARLGQTVAIWGVGGLGQYAIQIAKSMGTRVIAVDIEASKLDLARQLGADVVVSASQEKPQEVIMALGGAHVVLSIAPAAAAIGEGFEALRRCGTLVLIGLPPGDIPVPIVGSVRKGIQILTSAVGSRQDIREVLALAAVGKIKSKVQTCRLEQINGVFQQMREGRIAGRVVVEFPE